MHNHSCDGGRSGQPSSTALYLKALLTLLVCKGRGSAAGGKRNTWQFSPNIQKTIGLPTWTSPGHKLAKIGQLVQGRRAQARLRKETARRSVGPATRVGTQLQMTASGCTFLFSECALSDTPPPITLESKSLLLSASRAVTP